VPSHRDIGRALQVVLDALFLEANTIRRCWRKGLSTQLESQEWAAIWASEQSSRRLDCLRAIDKRKLKHVAIAHISEKTQTAPTCAGELGKALDGCRASLCWLNQNQGLPCRIIYRASPYLMRVAGSREWKNALNSTCKAKSVYTHR